MVLTQINLDESLQSALAVQTTTLKKLIDESISAIRNELIATLNGEIDRLNERVVLLESTNEQFESRIESLEMKIESNFQYQRNSSVTVAGIPNEIEHCKLEGIIIEIFNKVCFHQISHRDIVACHRLSQKNDTVIVKF